MELAGVELDLTQRLCMVGMKAMAGQCIDQEVPGPQGKTITAKVCACDSDLCNSAPFNIQEPMFVLLVSAIVYLMN